MEDITNICASSAVFISKIMMSGIGLEPTISMNVDILSNGPYEFLTIHSFISNDKWHENPRW